MLEPLLGSTNAERCLLFLLIREQGYASEIAQFFDTDLYGIQKQLESWRPAACWPATRRAEPGSIVSIPGTRFRRNCGACWRKPYRFNPSLHVRGKPCRGKRKGKKCGKSGGEGGIRTHGTLLAYTAFPVLHLRPLGHLSVCRTIKSLSLRRPAPLCGAGTFGHSVTSPAG
jgi:hypothetical protein